MFVIHITSQTSLPLLHLRAAVAARTRLTLITGGIGHGPRGGDHKIASS